MALLTGGGLTGDTFCFLIIASNEKTSIGGAYGRRYER